MRFSAGVCIASLFLVGWGSCSAQLETACVTQLPELEREIAVSLEELQKTEIHDRQLASLTQDGEGARWMNWAEVQLKRTQYLIDAVDENPELNASRARLNDLANELVAFHGYAQGARRERMRESLKQVLTIGTAVKQELCSR